MRKGAFLIGSTLLFLLVALCSSAFANVYAGNNIASAYGVKANIAWSVSEPAGDHAAYVTTCDSSWIQAGLARSDYAQPHSYEEYHNSGGAKYLQWYSAQAQGYYRSYQVTWVSGRTWQAYIQGAARIQGYVASSGAKAVQAAGELIGSTGGSVTTKHRDCMYRATTGSSWSWFDANEWDEQSPWSLTKYGTYDDFDEVR